MQVVRVMPVLDKVLAGAEVVLAVEDMFTGLTVLPIKTVGLVVQVALPLMVVVMREQREAAATLLAAQGVQVVLVLVVTLVQQAMRGQLLQHLV